MPSLKYHVEVFDKEGVFVYAHRDIPSLTGVFMLFSIAESEGHGTIQAYALVDGKRDRQILWYQREGIDV